MMHLAVCPRLAQLLCRAHAFQASRNSTVHLLHMRLRSHARSLVHRHSLGHVVPPLTGSTLRDTRLFLEAHTSVGEAISSGLIPPRTLPNTAPQAVGQAIEEVDSLSLLMSAKGGEASERELATANITGVLTIMIAVYHCAQPCVKHPCAIMPGTGICTITGLTLRPAGSSTTPSPSGALDWAMPEPTRQINKRIMPLNMPLLFGSGDRSNAVLPFFVLLSGLHAIMLEPRVRTAIPLGTHPENVWP